MKPFERALAFYEGIEGDLMADVAAYGTMACSDGSNWKVVALGATIST